MALDFRQQLSGETEAFLTVSAGENGLDQAHFYTLVSCDGGETGEYAVFCGREPQSNAPTPWNTKTVPGGWYAAFDYQGDMYDIREVFIDDLYRWVMVKEARIRINGVGMLTIYPGDYPWDNAVKLLIPIEEPV